VRSRHMRQQQQKSSEKNMLISENKAAQLLQRDRGTIKRALHGIDPDGYEQGQPRFRIATVMRAMIAHTRIDGRSRPAVSLIEPELVTLEQADLKLNAFLKRLRAERDLERRRAPAESNGKLIGVLDRAFAASIQAQGPDGTPIFTPLRERVVASAIKSL
jgi:hypothetical protein